MGDIIEKRGIEMENKTMEQQIAELTPEQKASMGGIYRMYVICLAVMAIAALLVGGGLFLHFNGEANEIGKRIEALEGMREVAEANAEVEAKLSDKLHNEITGGELDTVDMKVAVASMEYTGKIRDLQDEKSSMQQNRYRALMITGAALLVLLVAVIIIFKVKYPYFSENKYEYMKKMQKKQNSVSAPADK